MTLVIKKTFTATWTSTFENMATDKNTLVCFGTKGKSSANYSFNFDTAILWSTKLFWRVEKSGSAALCARPNVRY